MTRGEVMDGRDKHGHDGEGGVRKSAAVAIIKWAELNERG
jgi:hypothetical protein